MLSILIWVRDTVGNGISAAYNVGYNGVTESGWTVPVILVIMFLVMITGWRRMKPTL
ncbi:MAG: hypothetical protein ACM4AI_07290 [Acidobacteriota bacterium]